MVAGPRQRNHPDFPLRGFVRCETCGRPLTGSWSKGRTGHYAYYHCQTKCRAVNVSKAVLEGAFADELALLQTAATAPLFNYLAPSESADEKMVSRIFASWNRLDGWLRQVDRLRRAA